MFPIYQLPSSSPVISDIDRPSIEATRSWPSLVNLIRGFLELLELLEAGNSMGGRGTPWEGFRVRV